MQNYEIVIIINPEKKDNILKIIEYYKNFVNDKNGKIHRIENWGRRQLSYPIRKYYKAYYILFNIEISKIYINSLKEDISFNENIIRNLIIKMKLPIKKESPIMKIKNENDKILNNNII